MKMSEAIYAERTTPYGFKLASDKNFRKATEAVRKFVKDKLPATLEIVEENAKDGITKVKVMGGAEQTSQQNQTSAVKSSSRDNHNISIVRQCCLKAACEVINGIKPHTIEDGIKEVKKIAEEFEKWVIR